MTGSLRENDVFRMSAYGNVWPAHGDDGANRETAPRRWPVLVRELRHRTGLSQAALAAHLGVTQASVSRWESGADLPSIRLRKAMRDMLRDSDLSRAEKQLRVRLRYAPTPLSVLAPGARFLDFSRSFAAETTTDPDHLRGRPVYGHFGALVDATTESWERSGIFGGDVACTVTVLALSGQEIEGQMAGQGAETVYLRNFDTPYRLDDRRVISICETCRVTRDAYESHLATYGAPVFTLSFDAVMD